MNGKLGCDSGSPSDCITDCSKCRYWRIVSGEIYDIDDEIRPTFEQWLEHKESEMKDLF